MTQVFDETESSSVTRCRMKRPSLPVIAPQIEHEGPPTSNVRPFLRTTPVWQRQTDAGQPDADISASLDLIDQVSRVMDTAEARAEEILGRAMAFAERASDRMNAAEQHARECEKRALEAEANSQAVRKRIQELEPQLDLARDEAQKAESRAELSETVAKGAEQRVREAEARAEKAEQLVRQTSARLAELNGSIQSSFAPRLRQTEWPDAEHLQAS